MARSTVKSSTTQAPSLEQIVATAVAAALQGMTQEKPATSAKPKPAAKQEKPRTISDPTRGATNRQVWLLAARLHQAHYGKPLPKPLTMGDVQTILDDLS